MSFVGMCVIGNDVADVNGADVNDVRNGVEGNLSLLDRSLRCNFLKNVVQVG